MSADGRIIHHDQIGEVPADKLTRRRIISLEKAVRLMMNALLQKEHLTSRQSRDPGNLRWGGAITRTDGVVDSFTGFTEEQDEACMLVLYVVENGSKDSTELFAAVTEANNNSFATRLLKEWDGRRPIPTT